MTPARPAAPFLEALQRSILVFDGAMGSLLYERGVFVTQNFEQLNVTRPDIVKKIHGDYVDAGAQVIETNTFGGNSFRLERYGLVNEVRSYNLAGARVAREAAGSAAYVAGSIGPTGIVPGVATQEDLRAAASTFAEQAAALVEGGADLLMIETFRHMEELRIAIDAARRAAPGTPILASVTFDAGGTVADGSQPEGVAAMLRDFGVDAIGINCGDGPQLALSMAERMRGTGLPLCAQPNAGLPRTVDGRLLYMATPEYFDVFTRRIIQAGAQMVGGCCGTTPEHIRWMVKSARMLGGGATPAAAARPKAAPVEVIGLDPIPLAERSRLASKIAAGQFVVSVEVNPAPGLSPDSALAAAKMLIDNGIDVVNVADGPRATARMSNLAFCALLIQRYGIEPILHVCGRDRNLIGQMAHLLGASAVGIQNLVVITGDPPKIGDYPEATAVYDLDSIGLLNMASTMNRGLDPAGKRIAGGQTSFLLATGLEPGAQDLGKEIQRLERKHAAGAEIVMTQPIFQQELLDEVLRRIAHLNMPVLIGVLPLVSYKNAEFLHNEVPGMQIPEAIRERMRKAPPGAEARKEGVRIAREMLFSVRDRVQGAYLMPPLGKYELALEVLDGLK
ncbi:bifunctional homocysteine S-methyltransferase/methylenetetrahydrofolate reductase [Chondromyces apiculatus]|uniref:5,10-methylenetetrahydrofolate reductase n=1 Tax=Chondromyces apiculatus DSM 436 TaxID=1192034 RepID=A0A017TBA0_9BACT|nr:bifunctional homocysteine S-methyltransferase/methylenetetrahydrofolate reductase [Chondromyces apiculatus]EYF06197.1 5,10-methylenetetrahydrofolate reductase [Chondromyces apiculatus DSM 436]